MLLVTALFLVFILFLVAVLALRVYGVYLCFRKKWYVGVISLLVPLFAEIVAVAQFFFKKDLLK